MDDNLDAGRVLDRIKAVFGIETDSELARFLDLSRQAVSTARTRGSMEWRVVLEKCRDTDLSWILWGVKSTGGDPSGPATKADIKRLEAMIRSLRSREDQH